MIKQIFHCFFFSILFKIVGKIKEPKREFVVCPQHYISLCQSPPYSCGSPDIWTFLTRKISTGNCSKSLLKYF